MKNPHGVEPTRYIIVNNSAYSIRCSPKWGPVFGGLVFCYSSVVMFIHDHCNKGNDNFISSADSYRCHPEYKSSLYVNTAGPENDNMFTVLDYEVYTYN